MTNHDDLINQQKPAKHYDLLIAGGGMVGASLACALLPTAQALNLRIGVLERFPLPESADRLEYQPSFDARSTALAFGSRQIFKAMGVWETLNRHLCPIREIQVSDRGHFGATRLCAEAEGVPALGYVVENQWLGRVLVQRLLEHGQDRVDYICPAEVQDVHAEPGRMLLHAEIDSAPQVLSAELLVVADGGRSQLRERLGVDLQDTPYRQCALIANLVLDRAHRGVAYERFTDSGPMALLPLESHEQAERAALVWTLPLESADAYLGMAESEFLAELQDRFGYRAGRFVSLGERHCYPLSLVQAREQVRSNLVVLGNAAHALHPIAGQGFNLALRGVASLAEQLIRARVAQRSLGDLGVLSAYLRERERDQQMTIGFSDRTTRLFSNSHPLAVVARNLGMMGLQAMPPLKHLFARSAMGLDSPAPDLSLQRWPEFKLPDRGESALR